MLLWLMLLRFAASPETVAAAVEENRLRTLGTLGAGR